MDDLRPESLILLLVFFMPPALFSADDKAVISASHAGELVDQFVTVEGKVVATQQEGRNTFLSLSSGATPELT